MAWTQVQSGDGSTYYVSDTGEISNDPSVMAAPQAITPENVAAAYQQVTGTAPSQDWVNQTVNAYQSDPNATIDNVVRDTSTAVATSGTPFTNVAGDPNSFAAGAQYYQSQGYVPGGTTYEGVPTSFVDPKTGKVVAQYGVTQKDQGGTPTSYASSQFQWNPTSSVPQGYTTALAIPQTDYNTGILDALKGVGMVAGTIGGAGLLDAALSGAGAADGIGSLTQGVTSDSVQAFENALPQEYNIPSNYPVEAPPTDLTPPPNTPSAPPLSPEPETPVDPNQIPPDLQPNQPETPPTETPPTETPPTTNTPPSPLSPSQLTQLATKAPGLLSSLLGKSGSTSGESGLGSLLGLGALGALGAAALSGSGSSGPSTPSAGNAGSIPTKTLNWNYSAPPPTDNSGIAYGRQYLNPQYAAQGGQMKAGGLDAMQALKKAGLPVDSHYVAQMEELIKYGATPEQAAHALASAPRLRSGGEVHMASGGIGDLGSYSDGGRMLKGPGDGMSDSIPATIANKRPARLANDEFVVPADVVSGLGNGSSDAGAKVLYKMMDKVRKARTGTTKQGKQINPDKFVPA